MPLTLVLGPANSAKAGEVLGAYAAAAARGAVLVVPTALDAEHYARELSAPGVLFGSVLTFGGLVGEIARRTALAAARLSELQRERLLRRALAAAPLPGLEEAAGSPGFADAAGALIAELQRSMVTPARFAQALAAWAGADAGRAVYARELASIYFAYRRELERARRLDGELLAWRALDALRGAPARWGASAVFFYGFDDLNPLQRDAVETLSTLCGVEVTVSLTYESARAALDARAEAVEALRPLAQRVLELPGVPDHYDPGAREVLHHLERALFQPEAGRVPAGGVVRLMEAGGERAEAELVAAEILELRAEGVPAEEIAVVARSPERSGPPLRRVLEQYGIPSVLPLAVPLAHTGLGRGLLALARTALPGGHELPVAVLLDYLRAPGVLADPHGADVLEAEARRHGLATVGAVLRSPAANAPGLASALQRVAALREARDPAAQLALDARELLSGAGSRRAPVLSAGAELDGRACAAVLAALRELEDLGDRLSPAELIEMLEQVRVEPTPPAASGAVLITGPLEIRARRFAAVLVTGLQEGEFPAAGRPDPFLPDELRAELAAASGLRLRLREDTLARERYLLYSALSRANRRIVLSFRSSDEEGNLALPSPFLRDVADCLDDGWWGSRRRRLLADVTWSPSDAPTPRERALAAAAAGAAGAASPPVEARRLHLSPLALEEVRHRDLLSAGALEGFAQCPVRWLVDRQLEPELLEPTPEAMARGSFMHEVLEHVLSGLDGPVTPQNIEHALTLLAERMEMLPADIAPGQPAAVRAAAAAAIEADLRRYLWHEARTGCAWRPYRLEQRFGFEGDEDSLPALELRDGQETVRVRGVIDRIDIDGSGRRALVRDYKSGAVRPEHQRNRWTEEHRLQVALYMLAVRELLGLEPAGGLYQPLRGGDLRARGAFLKDAELGQALFAGDGCEAEELDTLLDEARASALALASRLRAGELEPCPATCSREGCRYPAICRTA